MIKVTIEEDGVKRIDDEYQFVVFGGYQGKDEKTGNIVSVTLGKRTRALLGYLISYLIANSMDEEGDTSNPSLMQMLGLDSKIVDARIIANCVEKILSGEKVKLEDMGLILGEEVMKELEDMGKGDLSSKLDAFMKSFKLD